MGKMQDALQRFLAGNQDEPSPASDGWGTLTDEMASAPLESADAADAGKYPAQPSSLLDAPLSTMPRLATGQPRLVLTPAVSPDEPSTQESPENAPENAAPSPHLRESREQRRIRVLEQHLADALTYIDELEERLRELGEDG